MNKYKFNICPNCFDVEKWKVQITGGFTKPLIVVDYESKKYRFDLLGITSFPQSQSILTEVNEGLWPSIIIVHCSKCNYEIDSKDIIKISNYNRIGDLYGENILSQETVIEVLFNISLEYIKRDSVNGINCGCDSKDYQIIINNESEKIQKEMDFIYKSRSEPMILKNSFYVYCDNVKDLIEGYGYKIVCNKCELELHKNEYFLSEGKNSNRLMINFKEYYKNIRPKSE